jgi:tetratricopeptide (TPR) repeat protein
MDPFHGMDEPALQALAILACPHWLPATAILTHFREELLPELPELLRLDLVRVTGSGALTVPADLRDLLLAKLLDRDKISSISARLVSVFEDGNPESRIEAYYHQLFLAPFETSQRMFGQALSWASEPHFAHALLKRLIDAWKEFDMRWGIKGPAAEYLRFVELLGPAHRKQPREELAILDGLRRQDDPFLAAHVDLRAGLILTALNRIKRAKAALTRAQDRFESIAYLPGCAQVSRALGRLSTKIDRYDEARAYHERALELNRELDLPVSAAQCLQGLAEIDSFTGNLSRATERYEEAIEIMSTHGGRTAEAHTRILFSQLLTMRGALDAASEHLHRAMQTYEIIGNNLGRANCLRILATVDLEAGKLDSARDKIATAEAEFRKLGTTSGLAACKEIYAQIEMLSGNLAAATTYLREAEAIFEKAGDRFGAANCLRDQGVVALQGNDKRQAGELLARSAAQFEEIGAELEAALSTVLAALAGRTRDVRGARRKLINARVELPRAYQQSWTVSTGRQPTANYSLGSA